MSRGQCTHMWKCTTWRFNSPSSCASPYPGPMAARKTRSRAGVGNDIVVVNAGLPARRSSGGGGIRRRRSSGGGKRRRSRVGGKSGGSIQTQIQSMAIGGFVYGQIVKNFPQLPQIPGLGRAGSVAAIGYFLKPTQPLLKNACIAAAVIAGYGFGSTGTVSGDDDDEVISG